MLYDYIVIGGGIIGVSLARELAKRNFGSILLLEKESGLGLHASRRNSGVAHPGFEYGRETLKSRLCVEGNMLLRKHCEENRVPFEQCGTLVTSRNQEEEKRLEELLDDGIKDGVPGIKIINEGELREREPLARGTKALFAPTGGIVDACKLIKTVYNEARNNGVTFEFGERAISIAREMVKTDKGILHAGHIINAAGLYSDILAHSAGVGKEYQIFPFRGEYRVVSGIPIRSMIYHPPNKQFPFLGVHLTKQTDGSLIAGPTATLALGREAYNGEINIMESFHMVFSSAFWNMIRNPAIREIAHYYRRLSNNTSFYAQEVASLVTLPVTPDNLKPHNKSGNRAQLVDTKGRMVKDFIVLPSEGATHIIGVVSPGLTSCFSFSNYLIENHILKR